jgi:hypothetical protein
MPRESVLGIALRTLKNVGAFFAAKAAFASHFHVMGFIFGHAVILLYLFGYLQFKVSLFKSSSFPDFL